MSNDMNTMPSKDFSVKFDNKVRWILQNTYEQLLVHLDGIAVILELADWKAFDHVKYNASVWLQENDPQQLKSYDLYSRQITHGALILGYSYLEVFIADLARIIYRQYPQKLSKDTKVSYGELLAIASPDDSILNFLIEREIRSRFSSSISSVLEHFEKKLDISIGETLHKEICEASLLRNCLVHAGDIASKDLAEANAKFQEGHPIKLSTADVHGYGLGVRAFALDVWQKGKEKKFW
jgi:hypothetical protein